MLLKFSKYPILIFWYSSLPMFWFTYFRFSGSQVGRSWNDQLLKFSKDQFLKFSNFSILNFPILNVQFPKVTKLLDFSFSHWSIISSSLNSISQFPICLISISQFSFSIFNVFNFKLHKDSFPKSQCSSCEINGYAYYQMPKFPSGLQSSKTWFGRKLIQPDGTYFEWV